MLGVAGFGALASLTPYRPYFLGIAMLALTASYWTTYRAKWGQLRAAGLRAYRPQFHEIVLWATTAAVALLALFPHYNPFTGMM